MANHGFRDGIRAMCTRFDYQPTVEFLKLADRILKNTLRQIRELWNFPDLADLKSTVWTNFEDETYDSADFAINCAILGRPHSAELPLAEINARLGGGVPEWPLIFLEVVLRETAKKIITISIEVAAKNRNGQYIGATDIKQAMSDDDYQWMVHGISAV